MRIDGWSIDGFGHFHEYGVEGLPGGLVVLHGENEAGKSTLLAFLRGVLFGFPTGRSSEPRYEPVPGVRHGGRVLLEAEDGRWSVDREAGRRRPPTVISPNGPSDEAALGQLLGGADATLFRNVFAFGLQELQELGSLSGDAVRSRIFAAGLVGAGRSAREVIRTLDSQAETLFTTTRATTREIPRLQREVRGKEDELRVARARMGHYRELLEQEAESRREMARLATAVHDRRRDIARLQLLLELWPVWAEKVGTEESLAAMEPVDRFPPDAAARLERALAALGPARERLQTADAEWLGVTSDRRLSIRVLDPRLRSIADEVTSCRVQLALYRSHLADAATLGVELRAAEARLSDKFSDLGPGWDQARLTAFDTSLPRQEEIRGWERRLAAAEASRVAADHEAGAAGRLARAAQEERDRLHSHLDMLPATDPGALEGDEAALRRIRANLADFRATEAKREARETVAEERRRILRQVTDGPIGHTWTSAFRWMLGIAAVALVAAVGLALVGTTTAAMGAGLVGILAAAVAMWMHSAARGAAAERSQVAERRREAEVQVAAADEELKHLRAEEGRVRTALERDARTLGLSLPLASADVEERARLAAEQRQVMERRARVEEELQEAEEALAHATGELAASEQSKAAVEERLERERAAWGAWKADAGLPATLDPPAVLDFLREVQDARGRLRARDEHVEKLRNLWGSTSEWERSAARLLERAGTPLDGKGEVLARALEALATRCEADVRARERSLALRNDQRRKKQELRAARATLGKAEAALDALLAEGGARDEAGFRERMAAFHERKRLREHVSELDRQITTRLGNDDAAVVTRADLASGRLQAWREGQTAANDEVSALELRRDEAVRRNSEVAHERQELERSADVPRLEAELEVLRTELAAAGRRWAVLTLARSLVAETLARYTRERQPGVLRQAEATFSQVTGGRYTGVMQDGEGESFVVLDADGRTRTPDQLSRGTAEQLYLSLRLALAEEFSRSAAPLPLVMDDVLVNFDPPRAHATAEALAEAARRRQVLVFTCHRSTARLLRRQGATILPVGLL